MAQNWLNKDGLFLQFGTDKTVSELGGEFYQPGPNRVIEFRLPMLGISTTSTAPTIVSNTTIFPAPPAGQMFIESVEIVAEAFLVGGTSFNIGLIQMDRATIPSGYGTGLISGEVLATFATTAGKKVIYTVGSTAAGSLIGTAPANATGPYYLTAFAAGTFSAGLLDVRINYRGIGTITQ